MSPTTLARFAALAVFACSVSAAPLIVGHRGTGSDSSSNPYPENSVPSIQAAFEEGADLVEIDIQLAKDGTIVLWHDDTVPTADGDKPVHELLPSEFPLLEGPTGITAEVPTFREALLAALDYGNAGKVLDIELKIVNDAQRAPLCLALAEILREERAGRRVMISTFDPGAIEILENELPGLESALLGFWKGSTLKKAKKLIAKGVMVEWVIPSSLAPWSLATLPPSLQAKAAAEGAPDAEDGEFGITASFADKAHKAGFAAGIWTVNKAGSIKDYADDGFDLIITDEPNVAREVLPPNFGVMPFTE